MLNDAVLASMKKSVLCWLATADANGAPNVSPKEIFCAHGPNVVLMANLASPGSAENIAHNPNVCVSFVDPFVQKGFKLKGQARLLHESDEAFATLALPLTQLAGPRFPFRSLFAIEIDGVEPIIAPSYRLYPETSEARQVESAMKSYGVRPDTD
ncbi:pyridoxamine 5'-phosphate oxidase family protein [Paraburkholderia tropica]|uniref:pyridoxamine 5'-phosphate oxidase family protein n=1 Tax=Paraburkholderia tropica TaxID=92647 RepID=UPI001590364D|nr:pyridoxamine 5'-phosphate oxidase family protein [Paraburkholderia tropica]